jgi:hypothetical protein
MPAIDVEGHVYVATKFPLPSADVAPTVPIPDFFDQTQLSCPPASPSHGPEALAVKVAVLCGPTARRL